MTQFFWQVTYQIPIEAVFGKTLKATIWACDRLFEKIFLGAVAIPMKDIFTYDSGTEYVRNTNMHGRSKSIIEKWYRLKNT